MGHFECRLWLPAPRSEVFAYFADARNLDPMTPSWFQLTILAPEPPIVMARGTTIDYRMRWRGLPMRWRSEVTVWEPERRFTYEQRRGPYRAFVHEHEYSDADGGTRVVDRVDYSTWLGRWVEERWVARDLNRIFEHRNAYVRGLFAGSESATRTVAVAGRA